MEITAELDGVRLAGSVWMPSNEPVAGVLMHPGSGPSDRHNDVLFPPIREHLLAADIAVCSFDKRGVGGSSGRWEEAGILAQADDLLAGLAAFTASLPGVPIGLFGHSQGGWVVIEAAGRGVPVAFVITNSGPGVSPARQERYSIAVRTPEAVPAFDAVVEALRLCPSLDEARRRLGAAGTDVRLLDRYEELFEDEALWRFFREIFAYEPRGPLSRIAVPVLAVFGSDDDVTPVEESISAFRAAVRPDLLEIEVFPGCGHRLQRGDSRHFVDGYLDRLASFVRRAKKCPRDEAAGVRFELTEPEGSEVFKTSPFDRSGTPPR